MPKPHPIALHGALVVLFGSGIFISGRSGIGKSHLILELVERGHTLVADDLVTLQVYHNSDHPLDWLQGSVPPLLAGLVQIDGLGIFDVRKVVNPRCHTASHPIHLHLQLIDDPAPAAAMVESSLLTLPVNLTMLANYAVPTMVLNHYQHRITPPAAGAYR
ncbi:MAG: hypothetical protein HQL49_08430 [Gammaproteobacteria bacterium]|nr:hypothetical protein [Gammaproteobacteria bacterium]